MVLVAFMTLYQADWFVNLLHLKPAPCIAYHWVLLTITIANFLVSYLWEVSYMKIHEKHFLFMYLSNFHYVVLSLINFGTTFSCPNLLLYMYKRKISRRVLLNKIPKMDLYKTDKPPTSLILKVNCGLHLKCIKKYYCKYNCACELVTMFL